MSKPGRSLRRLKTHYVSALIHPRRTQIVAAAHEWMRRIRGQPAKLLFYHRVSDAWSLLLAQFLSDITQRYGVELEIRVISALPIDCVPDPDRLDRYAEYDAKRVASAWGVTLPQPFALPDQTLCRLAERIILARPRLQTLLTATTAAWRGDRARLATMATGHGAVPEPVADTRLASCNRELVRRGHYLGGMLWYQGQWYWGLDRLALLETTLRTRASDNDEMIATQRFQPVTLRGAGTVQHLDLEFYFSFRSPYSYLAASRVAQLADRLGLNLVLRPLLPMVARGLPVARQKLRYIVSDAARVARAQGQPFGPLYDPLGAGVERSLAVLHMAQAQGAGRPFMLAAMRAIWCQAKDLTRDAALLAVAAEAGLSAAAVHEALASGNWRAAVEANAASLAVLGLWGVPGFCLRGPDEQAISVVWGQDRIWALERAALGIDEPVQPPRLMQ